jgi:AcrR family transcriptional regulator
VGIKERREREKQYVRTMIMKIVNNIVSEEGWGGVTIRKIAEEIEYSPPIIYEHFDSKEALLFELTKEAFEKLLKLVLKDIKGIDDPKEALHVTACTYYDFCIANKGYAKAIFGLDGVPCGVHLDIPVWYDLITVTKDQITKILGLTDPEDPQVDDAVHYIRWLTRGAISAAVVRIHMEEKDPPFNDHSCIKSMICHAMDAMIEGVKVLGVVPATSK